MKNYKVEAWPWCADYCKKNQWNPHDSYFWDKAMLEYRRQHNIFEVGDKVAAIGEDYLSTVMTVERVTGRALECFESGYIFTFQGVRHATPEEIAAGKRL